ncbi:hypothetical protein [Pedobacter sp. MC2016-24]|uniref:hypothetical protein n=1 Tax=Pedobacter sp. MC2016-24 TaxID=2780090 RepID=UPI00187F9672|nr:hypothetical protein [Pedobacter sp. MC2016-24]MBE9597794.1 hypothetical protein [Pedobacter sp. MC2016-24]
MFINIRNTTILVMMVMASLNCKPQDGETYWEINNIYREDKTPFKGLTEDIMQGILDYNFHFIKKGDSLYFDLPAKFSIGLSSFKSLSQLQIAKTDYYQMYKQSFERDTFKVMFKDLATMTESKNTVLEFVRISKAEYEDHIKDELLEQKAVAEKINAFKLQLKASPQIVLEPLQKLPQKSLAIEDDQGKAITLLVPKEIELKKSGQIKTQQFGAIKIGTFVKNAVVYDIQHLKKNYGLKQLAIWVSTDPATFHLDDWMKENPKRIIFKADHGDLTGYELDYDDKKQKAVIRSVFCLKYKKVGQAHVFLYADVYAAQFAGNYDPLKEMNEILNFNYLMLENITIQ